MGDFGKRIGLVHELRQLRGAEEFAHRGSRRLGVDQVMRHDGVDINRGHALLDGALHAHQAEAVLVFHELAHRADAAVAEMVDVVDFALAVAQFVQRLDDGKDVILAQHAHGVGNIQLQTHVHLHAAHGREVIALGIEEQALEQRFRRFAGRRLTGAHDAIDFDQRLLIAFDLVGLQRVADVGTGVDVVDVEHVELAVARLLQRVQQLLGDLVAGLGIDFAGLLVDQFVGQVTAIQIQRPVPAVRPCRPRRSCGPGAA